MHVINHPPIPFWGHIPEGVHPGLVIHIDGHIPHHSERFDINLVKGHEVGHHAGHHSTIALHVNPRVHEDYVVLNSRHHSDWGHEERHRHTHALHRGNNFNITIHVESEYYRVSVNGHHLSNFHHRMPYHEVGTLWIDGHVEIRSIEYKREHEHGQFQPAFQTNVGYVPGHIEGQHHHHHEPHHHHHNY